MQVLHPVARMVREKMKGLCNLCMDDGFGTENGILIDYHYAINRMQSLPIYTDAHFSLIAVFN